MELIKTYTQDMPATRFIGRKYGDADRVNGSFGQRWEEAFADGLFPAIEAAENGGSFFEDGSAYIGLMRCCGDAFAYYIGKFTAPGTAVPDGMVHVDFPAVKLGVGWVYGHENTGELYCCEDDVMRALSEAGVLPKRDAEGALWLFERYQCPRFTTPDEKGCVILDVCFFAE